MRDRTARTVSLVMPSMKPDEIARQMLPVLGQDTVLCIDAYCSYYTVCKTAGINHVALYQNKGERTRGVYHIQNRQRLSQPFEGLDPSVSVGLPPSIWTTT
jgi:hypothetical protein